MADVPAPRPKALNPMVKFALELGPLALFFISYSRLGIFAATGVLMASVVVTLAVSYAMLRRIPVMPLVTAAIVLIFGAALFVGLWLKKPLLKILFDGALHVTEEGWRKLTWRWAFFFLALAILNEIVWRTQSTDLWVKFKTFGFLPLTLMFAVAQAPLIMRYETKEEDMADNDF